MNTLKMALAAVVLLAVALVWSPQAAAAAETPAPEEVRAAPPPPETGLWRDLPPAERRARLRERIENLPPEEREAARERLREALAAEAREGQAPPARLLWGNFVERYLEENERFIKMREEHHRKIQAILGRMQELHRDTMTELRDPNLSREQKQDRLADARARARELLGQIFDERLRFQRSVAALLEANREDVIDKAAEFIFRQQQRRVRPARPAEGEAPPRPPRVEPPPPPPRAQE